MTMHAGQAAITIREGEKLVIVVKPVAGHGDFVVTDFNIAIRGKCVVKAIHNKKRLFTRMINS